MMARRSFGPREVALITRYFIPVVVTGGNGMSIQSASGKSLGHDLDAAFQAFRLLPESDRKPTEIPPAPATDYRLPIPPGGTVIRVFTRGFDRDQHGILRPIAQHVLQYCGPQREFLWLTAEETNSFVPENPSIRDEFPVPPPIVERICRFHLLDNTICLPDKWSAKECRAAQMKLRVEEKSADHMRLSIIGTAALATDAKAGQATREADFAIRGKLDFNTKIRRIEAFDMVALGDYRNRNVSKEQEQNGKRPALTLGVAFELAAPDSLGYGTVPFALWSGVNSCRLGSPQIKEYFGLDPYQPK